MYVSSRAKDATLNYDETFDSWSFSGFSSSGYHRTFNELGKINAVGERFFGANAKLSLHKSILSANFNYVKYSVPYKPKQNFENIFSFHLLSSYLTLILPLKGKKKKKKKT